MTQRAILVSANLSFFVFSHTASLCGADLSAMWILWEPPFPSGTRSSQQHLQHFPSPHDRHCLRLITSYHFFNPVQRQHQPVWTLLNWDCLIFFKSLWHFLDENLLLHVFFPITKSLNHPVTLNCKKLFLWRNSLKSQMDDHLRLLMSCLFCHFWRCCCAEPFVIHSCKLWIETFQQDFFTVMKVIFFKEKREGRSHCTMSGNILWTMYSFAYQIIHAVELLIL